MSYPDELFDLSLFAESPTNDHHFSIPQIPSPPRYEEPPRQPTFYQPAMPRDYQNKPLPPLPQRRNRPRACDLESRCILRRIQRIGSNEQPNRQNDTLLQRRNPTSPPQLTLSVPHTQTVNRQPASAMVWMPDEQMWLIAGEVQQDMTAQNPYPSPPPYSPQGYTRSEPSPNIPPPFDLTPPMTPVQHQFQTLMQQRPAEQPHEERLPRPSEDRMSPLFQEAMNSVPLMDPADLFLPSLSVDTSVAPGRNLRPQHALERSASDVSPQSSRTTSSRPPVRSVSTGTRGSNYFRSDGSDTRSFYSAVSVDLTQPQNSASRWAGLARRIASPSSGMD